MAQSAKAQEPSMEEILASIRRIIADDETKPAAPAAEHHEIKPPPPPPPPKPRTPPPPLPPAASVELGLKQDEVDAMLADLEAPHARAPEPPGILDLTESMAAPPPPPPRAALGPAPGFRTIDGQSDITFAETPEPALPAMRQGETLLSNNAHNSVNSAFNMLAQTVLANNSRTLEDLVKEMLRPMLKTWLDDNLPGLVERIVRQEIERVSRGRS